MKRAWTAVVALAGSMVVCGWAWAGIEGSKHDFRKQPWSGGESCGVCHTPHQSEPPKAAPLWEPQADLNRRFGAGAGKLVAGSGTTSCLRCHDGTVARETFNVAREPGPTLRSNLDSFGVAHGGTDHPVGVEYPELRKGYRAVVAVLAKGTVQLPQNRVECISCHDPHAGPGVERMLVASNARSALCLTCHQK